MFGHLKKVWLLKSVHDFLDTQFFCDILWVIFVDWKVDWSCDMDVMVLTENETLSWERNNNVFVSSQTYKNGGGIPELLFIFNQLSPGNRLVMMLITFTLLPLSVWCNCCVICHIIQHFWTSGLTCFEVKGYSTYLTEPE